MEKEVENESFDNPESKNLKIPEEDKIEDSLEKEAIKRKQGKQVAWALFLMISVIIIILAVPFLRDNIFNKFSYNGMEFSKSVNGQLEIFSTKIPLYSSGGKSVVSGMVVEEITKEKIGDYELMIRVDPRKIDNINVDLDINNITFVKKNIVYIAYNSSDPSCEHNIISAADLARFLLNFGGLDVEGAVMDKEYATASKIPYVTCDTNPSNTVIRIVAGKESKIYKVKENCYELMYNNCDVQGVTNRFILSIAEGYTNTVVNENR